MKLIKMECPNCGSILEMDSEREFMFCQFCGQKLYLDKEAKIIVTTTRKIDEARIKEAEAKKEYKLKQMDSEKEMFLLKAKIAGIVAAVILLIFLILYVVNRAYFENGILIILVILEFLFMGWMLKIVRSRHK